MSAREMVPCRKALSEELARLAGEHEDLFVLTSDARGSVMLSAFAEAWPDRLVECGIAEQNEVGVAAGMALAGLSVFVCAPAPFLSARAYEQLKVDVAYNRAPVRVCGVSGGVSYGALGSSHHAINDVAATRGIDGLTVLVPSDAAQTRALVRWMAENPCPVYMRMGRGAVPRVYDDGESFEPGHALTLREGGDLAIIAMGEMVAPALGAAELLAARGVGARVIDMFCVSPLDEGAVVAAARETSAILTVEEHSVHGGLGGAVAEAAATSGTPVPMDIVGIPDGPTYEAESPELFEHYGLTAEGIAARAAALLDRVGRGGA